MLVEQLAAVGVTAPQTAYMTLLVTRVRICRKFYIITGERERVILNNNCAKSVTYKMAALVSGTYNGCFSFCQ
jgi:hypothetical protein